MTTPNQSRPIGAPLSERELRPEELLAGPEAAYARDIALLQARRGELVAARSYGRCTDHVCKDIRAGLMGRGQGIQLVKAMDPVKPGDLKRWLAYVGMREDELERLADTFRDPRVWRTGPHGWEKDETRVMTRPADLVCTLARAPSLRQ